MDFSGKAKKRASCFTVFSHKNIILNTIEDYIKTNEDRGKEQKSFDRSK